ncbi:MAG TPA: Rid family detoxifying hydrolase [Thermoproteota archaeon]|nr:Rid family detoxifying hydrolase [Thermoproteota archaeon]
MKRAVESAKAPKPIGPYSQATVIDGFMFLSGLIPITPEGNLTEEDIAAEFRTIIRNAAAILAEAGSSLEKVVKVTVFMTDLSKFDAMNKAYSEVFRPPFPARSTVQVSSLPKAADLEIDMIAYV